MKKTLFSFLAILLAESFVFSGCSSTGDGEGNGISEQDLNAQEGRFGSGSIPSAEGEGIFKDVRFDYDSARVNDSGRQNVEYNAEVIRKNPGVKITLEGHCDERGTAEYNLALGDKRAKAVKSVLVSYGIPSSQLETISYGKEIPLDPGHDESAYAKNRRVHFAASRDLPNK
ncbi:MAG: peptidoglycan-associated lipoprotein Pal [SAR324 cluster bacterium]|uniref:Peptidoglycan-associated protein n=1 Tax=SAR324 cluster bacterium TaxID=2024889 RepID=A0A7X9FRV9_9DELT|nr:peptidoglycan-associated lipoprotein Pal [SAR324 cluster bacterium]